MQFLGMVLISKKKYKSTILFLSSKLYFQLLYLSNQLKYRDESKTSISIIPSISRMDSNDTYISHTKIDTLHLFNLLDPRDIHPLCFYMLVNFPQKI